MALVVFIKGINVGGHRSFRLTALAGQLQRLDVVSVGAAGTFVVREPIRRAALRAEISSRLPFEAEVMICAGRDVLELISREPFVGEETSREIVRFVSVMPSRRARHPAVPATIPTTGRWGIRVLGQWGPFVFGLHRREMSAIGHLGRLEKLIGAPLATRNWATMLSVGDLLKPSPR